MIILISLHACKKDDNIGVDLVNFPGDKIGMHYTDTCTLVAWSITEDSLPTGNVFLHLLGSYYDPVFGEATSSIYTQCRLSTNNVSFGSNPVADSIILTLPFHGYYGDSAANLRVKVFEIDPSAIFHVDSTFYSNHTLPVVGNPLFDMPVRFNPNDSVEQNGKMHPPMLRIKLLGDFANKFVAASGTSDLTNNDAFLQFFKGLHITVVDETTINKGIIGYFNLNSDHSRLTLHYHNDVDTLTYPFIINDKCARFSHFSHNNYKNAEHGVNNQDSNGVNNRLYLQSMAGIKIRVKLPYLSDLSKDGRVAINRAELVIKCDPDDYTSSDYNPASKITIARITEEGKNAFTTDVLEGETFLGGTYDKAKKEYRIRVTRYIHDILSGKYENHGLVLMVSAAAIKAERSVILGNSPSEKNLRLEIIYGKP